MKVINGQQAYEKSSKSAVTKEMQIETTKHHLTSIMMVII
jgi:hypothetical protein